MCSFNQQRRQQKDVRPPFSISFLVEIQGEKYMESQMFSERWEQADRQFHQEHRGQTGKYVYTCRQC